MAIRRLIVVLVSIGRVAGDEFRLGCSRPEHAVCEGVDRPGDPRNRLRRVSVVQWLDLSAAPSHALKLLDLEDAAALRRTNVPAVALAVLFVLLVDVEKQLLNLGARCHVLRVKARADAEVERVFGLLLLRPLLEPGSLASEAKLYDLAGLGHVPAALLDDALHVAAFGTDQASRHLKLPFVVNLDVVAARILGLAVSTEVTRALALSLRMHLLERVHAVGRVEWLT